MYDIVNDYFVFVAMGIVSIAYACSWIYKFQKRKNAFNKFQYVYIALAFIVIILGLSTFFTKFSLNCLCGIYAGVSELLNLRQEYIDRKENINIYHYLKGFGLGMTLIMIGLNFILCFYLD
jgi:hypothetical protein